MSSQSIHNCLSNVACKQTDKPTLQKQSPFAKVMIVTQLRQLRQSINHLFKLKPLFLNFTDIHLTLDAIRRCSPGDAPGGNSTHVDDKIPFDLLHS